VLGSNVAVLRTYPVRAAALLKSHVTEPLRTLLWKSAPSSSALRNFAHPRINLRTGCIADMWKSGRARPKQGVVARVRERHEN
jgi:hypothetical protein